MRERFDGMSDVVEKVYGFETTHQTKQTIIRELVTKIRENPDILKDPDTVKELFTFVHKSNGKMEAIDGYHDDLVMALAITHFISRQQESTWMKVPKKEDTFLRDNFGVQEPIGNNAYVNWEDY